MLLRNLPLTSGEEFSSPATLTAERRRPDFRTSRMPQVIMPIYLEP